MKFLDELSATTNLSQSEILTQLVHAGLRSIAEDGGRMVFPLRFHATPAEPPKGRASRVNYLNEHKP